MGGSICPRIRVREHVFSELPSDFTILCCFLSYFTLQFELLHSSVFLSSAERKIRQNNWTILDNYNNYTTTYLLFPQEIYHSSHNLNLGIFV